ncbi:PKD domain-containing protein [Tautonia rosea]|uniref:PKD domain-containing protein n=1 Tax=Tautonia rosea TaxID=2728037 RepID=UPI001472F97C|nr:PKD domain-containing protein [Tautonia rosea]
MNMEQLEERALLNGSQEVLRLDFGLPTSAVASGWNGFAPSLYSPERGYGWTGTLPPSAADFGTMISDSLVTDFHYGIDNSFKLDVPNGQYDVVAIVGARPFLKYGMTVWAEGLIAASRNDDQLAFRVDVTDEQLDLRFLGIKGSIYLLAGLQIDRVSGSRSVSAGNGYSGQEGAPITLRATASSDNSDLTFSWDLNGDGTSDATGQEIVHVFPDNGTYPVTVRVTDPSGQEASATTTVTVTNAPPRVTLTSPTEGVIGNPLVFESIATDPSSIDQAAAFKYVWDFGDGTTSTAARPNHTYTTAGTYNVSVTVTDKDGGVGSVTSSITIKSSGLTASAGGPYQANEGSPVTLRGSANGTSVGPLAFYWDTNGDGNFDTAGPQISPTFADNGQYTVRLRVSDGSGQQSFDSTTVSVANVAPSVSVGGPYSGMPGMGISFHGSATDPSSLDQAAGFQYAWDFGDGSTSNAAMPTHTYASPGTYTIRLRVTDKDDAVGSATTTATVTMTDHDHGNPIHTHHDTIPDFGANATIVSASSGSWSDPNTWSTGRLPTTDDVVAIQQGHTVSYDLVSDDSLKAVSIHAGATLDFRTNIDTKMLVGTLLVRPDGALIVGTEANPVHSDVRAEIVIADRAIDTTFDPDQFGTGLIALGKVTMHGAAKSETFVNLAVEPKAGDTTLTLSQSVIGWQPGDQLILPDTSQWKGSLFEELTLDSISPDGTILTLRNPLQYHHLGARDGEGNIDFLGDVGNLTRNLILRSENARGTRGHSMFTSRADVDIRYVQFADMGRTQNTLFDNTKYDSSGNVIHVGTNQLGRYALHMHHMMGPVETPENGYQYTLQGNSIVSLGETNPNRWGITIHESHYGLIQDNVVYNVAGAGIITENGSESFNVIAHNFVVRVNGTGHRSDAGGGKDLGREGAGYWFGGTNNIIRENVAANISAPGSTYGYTYYNQGIVRVPKFKGADTSMQGQFEFRNMKETPILDFTGNTVYGTHRGLTIWNLGAGITLTLPISTSVVKDFQAWHVLNAFYNYPVNNLVLDGMIVRGDWEQLKNVNIGSTGVSMTDYLGHNIVIRNADIQGVAAGIGVVTKVGDTRDTEQATISYTIEDSHLQNRTNVYIESMWAVTGGKEGLSPRKTIIDNVKFTPVNNLYVGLSSQYDIFTKISLDGRPGRNLIQRDEIFVHNYNGVMGDNYQVYYEEQRADYVVPKSEGEILASPEEGLTNQENWERYGIAMGGGIAPNSVVRKNRVKGLVNHS